MWLETSELEVKQISQRASKVRRENNFQLLNYFLSHLDKILKNQKAIEPNLRTQIRLGDDDLSLFTKYKDKPYWRSTKLTAYGDPEFDPDISPAPTTTNKLKMSSPTGDSRADKIVKNTPNTDMDSGRFETDEDKFTQVNYSKKKDQK